MSVEIKSPPFNTEVILVCIDDSNPPENVQDWVEEGHLYKMEGMTNALNVDDVSIIISLHGKKLQPTPNMAGFRGQRLMVAFTLFKN